MEPGAEGPDAFQLVPAQVHPVGQQDYHLAQVQVQPKRGAGEAQVADANGGEITARGAWGRRRAGGVETQGSGRSRGRG